MYVVGAADKYYKPWLMVVTKSEILIGRSKTVVPCKSLTKVASR